VSLESFTDTNLAHLVRYCEENIERRRNQLEEAVIKQDVNRTYVIAGAIEELRHMAATAKSELRSRSKEK